MNSVHFCIDWLYCRRVDVARDFSKSCVVTKRSSLASGAVELEWDLLAFCVTATLRVYVSYETRHLVGCYIFLVCVWK